MASKIGRCQQGSIRCSSRIQSPGRLLDRFLSRMFGESIGVARVCLDFRGLVVVKNVRKGRFLFKAEIVAPGRGR